MKSQTEDQQTINIAVAGHTNTGKTATISTLIRADAGEIADRANVTKDEIPFYYDSLQATFIDTPGFQEVGALSLYLDLQKQNPDIRMPEDKKDKLQFDMDVKKTLEKSDAVLYIASLTSVPDASHQSEMEFVKKIQPKVGGNIGFVRRSAACS